MTPPGTVRPWVRWRAGTLDRALAVLAGIVLSPVAAAIAAAIRVFDGPPVVISIPRSGRDGVVFGMWKFRTMRAAGPSGLAGGGAITAVGDDRITPIGHRLRSFRLDELPQLVNVAGGQMALIGPRPETPGLVDDSPEWRAVLAGPPGITGPTQLLVHEWEASVLDGDQPEVRYQAEVLPVKLAVDRWYLEHAGPWVDALVAWSMVERFVGRRAETTIERRIRRQLPAAAAVPRPAPGGRR